MSKGWHIVHDEQGWIAYQARVSEVLSPESAVQWGDGPSQFPCLVTSHMPIPGKVFSCYVFIEEAQMLLEAFGILTGLPPEQIQAVNTVGPQQAEFNRSMWAHIRALIRIGKETGWITNDDYYKSMYDAALSEVDRDEVESKQSLLDGLGGSNDD